jgi:hypothetical protein
MHREHRETARAWFLSDAVDENLHLTEGTVHLLDLHDSPARVPRILCTWQLRAVIIGLEIPMRSEIDAVIDSGSAILAEFNWYSRGRACRAKRADHSSSCFRPEATASKVYDMRHGLFDS